MHDGYLFTLGVCGTPHGDRPATHLLMAMMAALPPVKRVAALGDDGALHAAILADLADAELLLLVTPAQTDGLPDRVVALLAACAAAADAGQLAAKVAALGVVGAPTDAQVALDLLQAFCVRAGITVAAAVAYPLILGPEAIAAAEESARQAYRIAEEHLAS